MISIRKFLADHPVTASAPCRIDSGGTWDIKAMSLPFEALRPTTVNIALTLRTSVLLKPFRDGRVKIRSQGFSTPEVHAIHDLALSPPFGIYLAAVSHFQFHGFEIQILSDSPVRSALGGSSAALVALIKALDRVAVAQGQRPLSRKNLLHLAYHLEDGISGGLCGIQDQAAAIYGGVHQWEWRYSHPSQAVRRTPLLDRKGQEALSDRLLVAYSGKIHRSGRINRKWIEGFLSGKTRAGWIKVNGVVQGLAQAIRDQDWTRAALCLREEMALRREITPEALVPVTSTLVEQAENMGCGARFAGAGGGGVAWAIGDSEHIRRLRTLWKRTLTLVRSGRILECGIDPEGVR